MLLSGAALSNPMANGRSPSAGAIFAAVSLAGLALLLYVIFRPFLAAIAWAVILSLVLFPLHAALRRRLGRRENLAALISTAATALLILLPGLLLVVALAGQAKELYDRSVELAGRYRLASPADLIRVPLLAKPVAWITARLPITAAQIQQWGIRALAAIASTAGRLASAFFLDLLRTALDFVLVLFTLFFFFRDGPGASARIFRLLPLGERRRDQLLRRLRDVLRATFYGTILTALLQGATGGVLFALFGLPSPVVFGALMTFLSLIPVGGTALVWVPASVVLALQGSWGRAVGLFATCALFVGFLDNWLKPKLISGRTRMNTLPVFFGVMGGIAAFGMIGLFVGPLILALALAVLEWAEEWREEERRPTVSPE